jgi:hypothetical protein
MGKLKVNSLEAFCGKVNNIFQIFQTMELQQMANGMSLVLASNDSFVQIGAGLFEFRKSRED